MNHFTDGQYTAYIGIDWSDTKHDICLQAANNNQLEFDCIPHQVNDIEQWALSLAFKSIRILYRCWQARTPYDELIYLEALRRRGSPLLIQLGVVAESA